MRKRCHISAPLSTFMDFFHICASLSSLIHSRSRKRNILNLLSRESFAFSGPTKKPDPWKWKKKEEERKIEIFLDRSWSKKNFSSCDNLFPWPWPLPPSRCTPALSWGPWWCGSCCCWCSPWGRGSWCCCVRREVADVAISENQANDSFKNASIFWRHSNFSTVHPCSWSTILWHQG